MKLFDDAKIYGSEYVMLPGFPRDLDQEELRYFADYGEICQGTYHKSIKLFLREKPTSYIQVDLSRDCELSAIVGSKVETTRLQFLAMRKPDDPEGKVTKRINIK